MPTFGIYRLKRKEGTGKEWVRIDAGGEGAFYLYNPWGGGGALSIFLLFESQYHLSY